MSYWCLEAYEMYYLDSLTRCSHCGKHYYGEGCQHIFTEVLDMSDEEAEITKARYEFGKLYNPDHNHDSCYRPIKKAFTF